ncbi:hypothetical protein [Dulcicalothrix desertica]|nr:hypothetical protein [Dulcicalothrix desertica]
MNAPYFLALALTKSLALSYGAYPTKFLLIIAIHKSTPFVE